MNKLKKLNDVAILVVYWWYHKFSWAWHLQATEETLLNLNVPHAVALKATL